MVHVHNVQLLVLERGQLLAQQSCLRCNFPVPRLSVIRRCLSRTFPRRCKRGLARASSHDGGPGEEPCRFQDQGRSHGNSMRDPLRFLRGKQQRGPDGVEYFHDETAKRRTTQSQDLFPLSRLIYAGILFCAMRSVSPRNPAAVLASLSQQGSSFLLLNAIHAASSLSKNIPAWRTDSSHLGFMASSLWHGRIPFEWELRCPAWDTGPMLARMSYMMDVLLERHPMSYVLFLLGACIILIVVGGIFFHSNRPDAQTLGDSMWDAWGCVCNSSMHLKEKSGAERTIGLLCAIGGLLFYSLLTGTMTAQFKTRIDLLREGARSKVMEQGHIVICGANNHLPTILQQLNKSHELALRDGTAHARTQKVLLLSERPRKDTEKLLAAIREDCPQIEILTRSGSLTDTSSFQRVAAEKARSVMLLANKDDAYEADADIVLSVLALQPLMEKSSANFVVEVSKASTADLMKSLLGLRVSPVQNLAAKLFVQCSRQRGLIDVYQQLLDHGREVDINLRSYPSLAGIPYRQVRRGFPEAVVCGMIRDGKIDFHPKDYLVLQAADKLLLICPKNTHTEPPPGLLATATKYRNTIAHLEKSTSGIPAVYDYDTVLSKSLGNPVPAEKHEKAHSKTSDWYTPKKERIIMLGWRPGVSEMVLEYDDYVGPGSELIILAEAPIEQRTIAMDRRITTPLKNVQVIHKIGNPMSRTDLKSAIMGRDAVHKTSKSAHPVHNADEKEQLPLSVVVVADQGWHVGDASKPDKQSVFALLLAQALCKKHHVKVTSLVAEFVDTKLGKQVVRSQGSLSFIGTSELTGLVTAQVTEHSELNDVWTELLNSWGNEIYVKDIGLYLRDGESASFSELTERANSRNEVAIGYGQGDNTVLNPCNKRDPLTFKQGDSLVVISEFE